MSIENVIQEHTKAIQENTVAITLLATALSKIAFPSVSYSDSAGVEAMKASVSVAKSMADNLAEPAVKQPAAKKEKPAPAPAAAPEPVVETAPVLTYETDVKPQLVKVAQLPDGRTKLSNLLAYFKAKTGADLKPEQFTTVLQHAQALLEEPDSLV